MNERRSIEQRLQSLEDQQSIAQLEAEYAVAWDLGTAEHWASLFTPDGVFVMPAAGAIAERRVQGREALERFCSEIKQRWTGLHYLHLPHVALDGDSARGTVFFEYKYVIRGGEAWTEQGTARGYYQVVYQRTEAGWRMRERIDRSVASGMLAFYRLSGGDAA